MRHALAAIEAIFFGGPCLLIAPRLEIGLGTLGEEDRPRALKRHARIVECRRNSTQKARSRRAHQRQRHAPLSINAWLTTFGNVLTRCA
jgi:hypothetical protein